MIWALHGALGSPSDWSFLPEAHAVNLWDEEHAQPSMMDWAQAFNRRTRQEDPAPLILGYSMGGRLALHALIESPSLWRGAIIVSTHLGLPDENDRAARRTHDQEWLNRLENESWASFLSAWDAQPVFSGHQPKGKRAFHPGMRRCFDEWSLGQQQDLAPQLKSIPCPVLWIAGERDAKFVQQGKRGISHLRNGRLQILPECGHRVLWESDEFEALVQGFQESLES